MINCNPNTLSCNECPCGEACHLPEEERRALENRKVLELMKEWGFGVRESVLILTYGQPLHGTA